MRTCSLNSGRLGLRTGGRSPSVLVADPTPFLATSGRRLLHTSYPRPPRAVFLGCTAGTVPCGSRSGDLLTGNPWRSDDCKTGIEYSTLTRSVYRVGLYIGVKGFFFLLSNDRSVKLTAHLHLAPRLRMSGTIPLLPLYAFMVWTGAALTFVPYSVCLREMSTADTQRYSQYPYVITK
jgi:hypothetical protein